MYGLRISFCASSSLNSHSLPLCRPCPQDIDCRRSPEREPPRHPSGRERKHAKAVDGYHLYAWDRSGSLAHASVVANHNERPDFLPRCPPAHPRLARTPLHSAVDPLRLVGEANGDEESLERGGLLHCLEIVGHDQWELCLPCPVASPRDRGRVCRECYGRVERELPFLDVYLPVNHFLGPRRVGKPSTDDACYSSCLARLLAPCALDPWDSRDSPAGRRVAGL